MAKADRRKSSRIKVHLSSGLEMKQLNKVSSDARLAVSRTRSKCAYNQWKFDTFAMCTENIEKKYRSVITFPVLAFMLFGQLASQLRIGLQDMMILMQNQLEILTFSNLRALPLVFPILVIEGFSLLATSLTGFNRCRS